MDPTEKALLESIKHWQRNVSAPVHQISISGRDCALCNAFRTYDEGDCEGCPVERKAGKTLCDGSPYQKVDTALERFMDCRKPADETALRAAILQELQFLKDLHTEYFPEAGVGSLSEMLESKQST